MRLFLLYEISLHLLTYLPTLSLMAYIILQALLEEERNLNASFSRKPFKTSSYMRSAPPVPHNFGVNKGSPSAEGNEGGIREEESQTGSENVKAKSLLFLDEKVEGKKAKEQLLVRTAIHRKIQELRLGTITRSFYSQKSREMFLAGNFCNQSGNVGEKVQIRKLVSTMKGWSKDFFSILSHDWPHLRFKIMLNSLMTTGRGDNSAAADLEKSGEDDVPISTRMSGNKKDDTGPKQRSSGGATASTEGADELLIQFETDSQVLPPHKVLNKYMNHLATHGKASELGLRRRCDRWGVVEVGLVEAEVPVQIDHSMAVRMEEYTVKKIEVNQEAEEDMNNTSGKVDMDDIMGGLDQNSNESGNHEDDVPIRREINAATSFNGSGSAVWYDPSKERHKVEIEDKADIRVLLYRSIEMSKEVSQFIVKALVMAKVDSQLANSDATGDLGSSPSTNAQSVPHSARGSVTALISARGFAARDASRTMSTANMVNQKDVLLNNTIMINCETKDFEIPPPVNSEDAATGRATVATSPIPAVIYDKNGRPQPHLNSEDKQTRKPSVDKISGFSSTFEEVCK